MGLVSLLLGKENPVSQFVDSRQNTLNAWGAGLASGPNFQQGLSKAVQYGAQAAPLDQQAAEQKRIENQLLEERSRTAEYLRSVPGGEKFADAIEHGGVSGSEAFKMYYDSLKPGEQKNPYMSAGDGTFFNWQTGDFLTNPNMPQGGTAERSLTPMYMRDANGNIVVGQIDKAGNITQSNVPQGLTPIDPFAMAGGKAGATVDAKTAAAARAALPGLETAVSIAKKAFSLVRDDTAGRKEWFGQAGALPRGIYVQGGSKMANFQTNASQTLAQAFVQARETLKGAGPITDYEGKMATQAYSRAEMALKQGDEQAFLEAVDDMEASIEAGYQKLVAAAQGDPSGGALNRAAGGGVDDILKKYGL